MLYLLQRTSHEDLAQTKGVTVPGPHLYKGIVSPGDCTYCVSGGTDLSSGLQQVQIFSIKYWIIQYSVVYYNAVQYSVVHIV